jgi:hypothetical protein
MKHRRIAITAFLIEVPTAHRTKTRTVMTTQRMLRQSHQQLLFKHGAQVNTLSIERNQADIGLGQLTLDFFIFTRLLADEGEFHIQIHRLFDKLEAAAAGLYNAAVQRTFDFNQFINHGGCQACPDQTVKFGYALRRQLRENREIAWQILEVQLPGALLQGVNANFHDAAASPVTPSACGKYPLPKALSRENRWIRQGTENFVLAYRL